MRKNCCKKKKLKYLEMIRCGKPKRNSKGCIVRPAQFQNSRAEASRIQQDRRLFCGTKTITPADLETLRRTERIKSPYDVLLSAGRVPYSLLEEGTRRKKNCDFGAVFGKSCIRKKPKLLYTSLEELSQRTVEVIEEKRNVKRDFVKGQSHRIWLELYKVLDSSDVIIHVLDARDPEGTLCSRIINYVEKEAQHKYLMYVLNKVDLVPTGVTAKWLRYFSKTHPAIAYHSNSISNSYGKENLMNLLKQLSKLYKKRHLSVGFVGFPNTGKSSIINTLRNKTVCKVASIPGETKVWQYVAMTKDIYLIDCPGVVPIADYEQAVLRGAIKIENIKEPEEYVEAIVRKAKESIEKTYGVQFHNGEDLILKLAIKHGKLVKGGKANPNTVSKMILHDWVDGRIRYFTTPKKENAYTEGIPKTPIEGKP